MMKTLKKFDGGLGGGGGGGGIKEMTKAAV